MNWEFLAALVIALLGLGISVLFLWAQPLVSVVIILGAWLELMAVVTWLEKREAPQD